MKLGQTKLEVQTKNQEGKEVQLLVDQIKRNEKLKVSREVD